MEPIKQGRSSNRFRVRAAVSEDAAAIAAILAEAFPTLYRNTFGIGDAGVITRLLAALYAAGHLSLTTTYVCVQEGQIVGIMILHLGRPIGRGEVGDYWRLL